jgi:hypothetical protein
MNTPIATVRTVTLTQSGPNLYVWTYDDDGTNYSQNFLTSEAAKSWLFTPVSIDVSGAPEEPVTLTTSVTPTP